MILVKSFWERGVLLIYNIFCNKGFICWKIVICYSTNFALSRNISKSSGFQWIPVQSFVPYWIISFWKTEWAYTCNSLPRFLSCCQVFVGSLTYLCRQKRENLFSRLFIYIAPRLKAQYKDSTIVRTTSFLKQAVSKKRHIKRCDIPLLPKVLI